MRWQPFYWLRCHVWDRYHVVRCDRNPDGYHWGWRDVDSLMLYANFELLRRFVEDEDGLKMLEFQGPAMRADAELLGATPELEAAAAERDRIYREVWSLWYWWTVERPSRTETVWESDVHYEKDTDMLVRLMRVRGSLWT